MKWIRPPAVVLTAIGALLLAGCGGSAPKAASGSTRPAVSGYGYYLSLGDSLAFGFQAAKFAQETTAHDYTPASFNTGYSDLVLQALKKTNPDIVGTNLGCPGETSATYLNGGCPATVAHDALHVAYAGTQSAAALDFLKQHTGRGLITVSLGANDLNASLEACPDLGVSCIEPKLPAVFAAVQGNLTKVLTGLRAAAPEAKIVVLELYNPYAVDVAASDLLATALNEQIADAATASGAAVVNAFPVFNGTSTEKATLCHLTAYCTSIKDIHPTDSGYEALAKLFLAAAG